MNVRHRIAAGIIRDRVRTICRDPAVRAMLDVEGLDATVVMADWIIDNDTCKVKIPGLYTPVRCARLVQEAYREVHGSS